MKKLVAVMTLCLMSLLAMASICSACGWGYYQPELPQKPQ